MTNVEQGSSGNAREHILNRLKSVRREAAPPPAWESRRVFDDLPARFSDALTAVQGEVRRAPDLEAALLEVEALLRELDARTLVANDEPPISGADLPGRWPGFEWHIVGQTGGDLRQVCARADVGLSGADAALAETGSLVVSSGPGQSRLATLLPPVHIALVPASCIVPDIFIWAARRGGEMPANCVLISGPSKSADIEFTLTLGIHGPGRLIVVLYEDRPPA